MIDKIGLSASANASKILQPVPKEQGTGAAELGQSFGDMLNNALNQLNAQQKTVDDMNDAFIRGDSVDTHQLMIQAEKLDLGLQMTVQVRNKMIEAYQEIMRMQM